MSILVISLSLIIGFLIVVLIFLTTQTLYFKYTNAPKIAHSELPLVSILIAMRNEEENIANCINSILQLNYPLEKLEILIGDDNSDDNSYQIVHEFTKEHPHIQLFKITESINNQKGKPNVLAHLAHWAKGEYFAFTDADIEVNPNWLRAMVEQIEPNYGIISGMTVVKNSDWQNIDWVFSLGMVKTISDLNIPLTAIGNNMLIPKSVYNDIGGFENLDFSIIEDYQIFQKITKKYRFKNLFHSEIVVNSKPIKGLYNLLMQRKRWMTGAVQLPWQIFGILGLQAAYYPFIILLFALNFDAALFLFTVKYFFQTLYISILFVKLRVKTSFFALLFYEFYSAIISSLLLFFYILPIKIRWKDRIYSTTN